jgi:hypothetical protein
MWGSPQMTYGPRMSAHMEPRDPADDNDTRVIFCAICGHSELVHSNAGTRKCLLTVCDCDRFVVGATPEIPAQVYPP